MKVQIDSLVRGKVGSTNKVRDMRVVSISSFGWVAGIEVDSGAQSIMYDFEVIERPRPLATRNDIPARLR